MTSRQKPTAGLWITVALAAVLVAYPLIFGPATWIADQDWCPLWVDGLYFVVYWPVMRLLESGPPLIRDAIVWWIVLWDDLLGQ